MKYTSFSYFCTTLPSLSTHYYAQTLNVGCLGGHDLDQDDF